MKSSAIFGRSSVLVACTDQEGEGVCCFRLLRIEQVDVVWGIEGKEKWSPTCQDNTLRTVGKSR